MISRFSRLARRMEHRGEKGAVLPLVAGILVVLLGLSAFALDLGWLYLSTSRLQRAADAAALAGVVHLPGFPALVDANTAAGATANGFTPGEGANTLSWRALDDNRLEVTMGTEVPSFFLKVFGMDLFDISRRSTSEYIKPVPLGSPFNSFGDGNDPAQAFWAAISGEYTAKIHGDAFSSRCDWSRDLGTCVDSSDSNRSLWDPSDPPAARPGDIDTNTDETNPTYNRGGTQDGYYYGIEKDGGNLAIDLYDPEFRRRQQSDGTCDRGLLTGECDRLTFSPPAGDETETIGPTTHFQLVAPDSTPLNPYDNTSTVPGCLVSYAPLDPTTSGTGAWNSLCSTSGADGIYVLKVWTTGGSGSNQYGIRATSTGTTPRVYGINDISIFANADDATLYLAEILPVHAGKKLLLEFFDPGEGADNATMTIRPAPKPDGTLNTGVSCDWTAEDSDGHPQSSGASCTLDTTLGGVAQFNNYWVRVTVDLPATYDCDPDASDPADGCWWRMDMNLNAPHDRTTWTARVIGNPVRLVPNE